MKNPFIIKELSKFNPDGVYGVGNQPLNTMLIATEQINGKEVVTQIKITDGITKFSELKNLVGAGSNSNFVPLSGTEIDKPITGALKIEAPINLGVDNYSVLNTVNGKIDDDNGSLSLYHADEINITANYGNANGVGYKFSNQGLSSNTDHSYNTSDLDYIQKKYVDDYVSLESVLNGGKTATDPNGSNYLTLNYKDGLNSAIQWELYDGVDRNAFFNSTLDSIYYNNNNSTGGYSSEVNLAYDMLTFQVNKIDSSMLSTVRLTAEEALTYLDDYSGKFTDRSLIDKGYANNNFIPLQGTSVGKPVTGNIDLEIPSRSNITIKTQEGAGLEFNPGRLVTLSSGYYSGDISYFSVSSNSTVMGYSEPNAEKRIIFNNQGIFVEGLEETTDDLKYIVVNPIDNKVAYKTLFGKATLPNMMSIGELETSEVYGDIRWQSQGDYVFVKLDLNGYIGADDNVSFNLTGLALKGTRIVKSFMTDNASPALTSKNFVIDASGDLIIIRNVGALTNVHISEVLTFELGVDAPAP